MAWSEAARKAAAEARARHKGTFGPYGASVQKRRNEYAALLKKMRVKYSASKTPVKLRNQSIRRMAESQDRAASDERVARFLGK